MQSKPQECDVCQLFNGGAISRPNGLKYCDKHNPNKPINEPQLSAEIERKFQELMTELLHADMPGLTDKNIPESIKKEAEANFRKRLTPIIKHFLATALEEQRKEYTDILEDLIDEDECSYDHHGYCQTHSWFETEPKCPHARAKAILEGK
jgi:hypothetical protein